MRKTLLVFLFLGSLAVVTVSAHVKHANGSMVDATDSPIDLGGGPTYDCSNCHHSGLTVPVVQLTEVPAFGTGSTYIPNTTYTLSLTVTGYPFFGLDVEMITSQSSVSTSDAGTFVTAVSNCKFTPPSNPYPTNVTHTAPIPAGQSAVWKWTSPASGSVYLYSCCLGANGDNQITGDRSAPMTMVLTPAPAGIGSQEKDPVDLSIFPNPVHSQIHLHYTLKKRSAVSVKIYDLNGKMAADLLNETLESGEQNFDSSVPPGLSKGIYTLKLEVEGIVCMKKLVIR